MLPEIPEVGAPDMEQAEPLPGEHDGCPFYNEGQCLVLNEPVSELGKDDAVEANEDEEGEFEEL
jgi:hypothetical protein